ncbi:LOW QUALITY PROTEIN: ribonuclease 8-like [Dugong dugon]
MAPAKTQVQPLLLLLLLGLWVAQVPVSAKPSNMTSAQWFETQHMQSSPQRCNTSIENINKYTKSCKNLNIFLHESFSSAATTGQTPSIACKNSCENCHQSQEPVSLTQYEHISEYPDCKYREENLDVFFVVAYDPPQQKDYLGYELVPVHLDKVV